MTTEEEGSALVSGRLLAEISRSLPGQPVQIASEGGRAVLTCGSATFTLLTMPEDEYPALPEMPPAAGSVGQRRVRLPRSASPRPRPAATTRCPP